MIALSKNWGLYGVELSLFRLDLIDMEIGPWEIVAIKAAIKIFGFNLVLASLEVADTRATIGFLNCFLTVFWG